MFTVSSVEAGSFDEDNYPVHKFCRDGDFRRVELFLSSQPLLAITEDNFKHWTPMHWAAYFGHLDCVRRVASVEPCSIGMQSSKTFQTPLHCAAEGGHRNCTLWLLQAGANPGVKDYSGETALHKAARAGHAGCVSLLVSLSSNIGAQNLNGQTASNVAEMSGHLDVAAFLRQHELVGIEFQSRRLLSLPRSGRKRMRDAVCDDDFCKRSRLDDMLSMQMDDNSLDFMNTSAVEHDKLCSLDVGYRNALLECLLNEYHGC